MLRKDCIPFLNITAWERDFIPYTTTTNMIVSMSSTDQQHLREPSELVKFILTPAFNKPEYDLGAITYRQNLVKQWKIPRNARVLDIGCGQGDFTVVAADAVGPSGRVVGLDPGPPDYGMPPIGEAQAHLKASPVGHQIEFVRDDALHFLETTEETFDFIVLSHAVWYFPGPDTLRKLASYAAHKCTTILINEFAIGPCRLEALPHLLTALAINALESQLDGSFRNQHCGLTPGQITTIMTEAGWETRDERIVTTPDEYNYAWREATMVLNRSYYVDDVDKLEVNEKTKSMLLGMKDAVAATVEMLPGGFDSIVNLDVWAGEFQLRGGQNLRQLNKTAK